MRIAIKILVLFLATQFLSTQFASASDPYQPEPPILRSNYSYEGTTYVVWTNALDQYPSETRTSGYTCNSVQVTCSIFSFGNGLAFGSKGVATLSGDLNQRNIELTVNRILTNVIDSSTAEITSTFYLNSDLVAKPNLLSLHERCCNADFNATYFEFTLSDTNSIASAPPFNIPIAYYLDPYVEGIAASDSNIGTPSFTPGNPFETLVSLRTPVQGESFTAQIGKTMFVNIGIFAADRLQFGPFQSLKPGLRPTISNLKSESDGCSFTLENYNPEFTFFFKDGDVTNSGSSFHIHGIAPGQSVDEYPSASRDGYILINNVSQAFRCIALQSREQIDAANLAIAREAERKQQEVILQNREQLFTNAQSGEKITVESLALAGYGSLGKATTSYLNEIVASEISGNLNPIRLDFLIRKAETYESLINGNSINLNARTLHQLDILPENINSGNLIVSRIGKLPAALRDTPEKIQQFISSQVLIEATRAAKLALRTNRASR